MARKGMQCGSLSESFFGYTFWVLCAAAVLRVVYGRCSRCAVGSYKFFVEGTAAVLILRACLFQWVHQHVARIVLCYIVETANSFFRAAVSVFLAGGCVGWHGTQRAIKVGASFAALRTALAAVGHVNRWEPRDAMQSASPWWWAVLDGVDVAFLLAVGSYRRYLDGGPDCRGARAGFNLFVGSLLGCYTALFAVDVAWGLTGTDYGKGSPDDDHHMTGTPLTIACLLIPCQLLYFCAWPFALVVALHRDSQSVRTWSHAGRDSFLSSGGSSPASSRASMGTGTCSSTGTSHLGGSSHTDLQLMKPLMQDGEGGSLKLIWQELKLVQQIGSGGSASVHRATLGGGRSEVAAKCVRLDVMTESSISKVSREAALLQQINHINVTRFFGLWLSPPSIYIVMELVPRGSLYDLQNSGLLFDSNQKAHLLCDTVHGLAALHNNSPQVLHCDLKSLNMLVDEMWCVKLCDFGESMLFDEVTARGHTPHWTAPEVLRGERYTPAADVYSLAMCAYEIWSGCQPFDHVNFLSEVERRVLAGERPQLPASMPKRLAALVRSSFSDVRTARPSLDEWIEVSESLVKCRRDAAFHPLGSRSTAGRFSTTEPFNDVSCHASEIGVNLEGDRATGRSGRATSLLTQSDTASSLISPRTSGCDSVGSHDASGGAISCAAPPPPPAGLPGMMMRAASDGRADMPKPPISPRARIEHFGK